MAHMCVEPPAPRRSGSSHPQPQNLSIYTRQIEGWLGLKVGG